MHSKEERHFGPVAYCTCDVCGVRAWAPCGSTHTHCKGDFAAEIREAFESSTDPLIRGISKPPRGRWIGARANVKTA